ncbi:hypothetical protein EPN18_09985 [bacterium]|nr:MAG: hypothetical protein EPN18_09985 [bacterium]
MSDNELEKLADRIVEQLEQRRGACELSEGEQRAVKDLIKTKRQTVKALLWIVGAVFLWALRDIYLWFSSHLVFK